LILELLDLDAAAEEEISNEEDADDREVFFVDEEDEDVDEDSAFRTNLASVSFSTFACARFCVRELGENMIQSIEIQAIR